MRSEATSINNTVQKFRCCCLLLLVRLLCDCYKGNTVAGNAGSLLVWVLC
jgi:hypothetical protein